MSADAADNVFRELDIDAAHRAALAPLYAAFASAATALDAGLAPHGGALHSAVSRLTRRAVSSSTSGSNGGAGGAGDGGDGGGGGGSGSGSSVFGVAGGETVHRWVPAVDRLGFFHRSDSYARRLVCLGIAYAHRHGEVRLLEAEAAAAVAHARAAGAKVAAAVAESAAAMGVAGGGAAMLLPSGNVYGLPDAGSYGDAGVVVVGMRDPHGGPAVTAAGPPRHAPAPAGGPPVIGAAVAAPTPLTALPPPPSQALPPQLLPHPAGVPSPSPPPEAVPPLPWLRPAAAGRIVVPRPPAVAGRTAAAGGNDAIGTSGTAAAAAVAAEAAAAAAAAAGAATARDLPLQGGTTVPPPATAALADPLAGIAATSPPVSHKQPFVLVSDTPPPLLTPTPAAITAVVEVIDAVRHRVDGEMAIRALALSSLESLAREVLDRPAEGERGVGGVASRPEAGSGREGKAEGCTAAGAGDGEAPRGEGSGGGGGGGDDGGGDGGACSASGGGSSGGGGGGGGTGGGADAKRREQVVERLLCDLMATFSSWWPIWRAAGGARDTPVPGTTGYARRPSVRVASSRWCIPVDIRGVHDALRGSGLKDSRYFHKEVLPAVVPVDRLSKLCKERTVFSVAVMLLVATRLPAYAGIVRTLLATRRAVGAAGLGDVPLTDLVGPRHFEKEQRRVRRLSAAATAATAAAATAAAAAAVAPTASGDKCDGTAAIGCAGSGGSRAATADGTDAATAEAAAEADVAATAAAAAAASAVARPATAAVTATAAAAAAAAVASAVGGEGRASSPAAPPGAPRRPASHPSGPRLRKRSRVASAGTATPTSTTGGQGGVSVLGVAGGGDGA
ncbi:hypothetical protein MMPV_007179 [Pyropia vietnamensis]